MISVALSPRIYVCAYHRWDKYAHSWICLNEYARTFYIFPFLLFCPSSHPSYDQFCFYCCFYESSLFCLGFNQARDKAIITQIHNHEHSRC